MTLAAGTLVNHFEISGQVGSGGMGEVYRARDHRLGRDVAIKVLLPELAGDRTFYLFPLASGDPEDSPIHSPSACRKQPRLACFWACTGHCPTCQALGLGEVQGDAVPHEG
jgi:serine/threonine protein kinase